MREGIIAVLLLLAGIGTALLLASSFDSENAPTTSGHLPGHAELRSVLRSVAAEENGGLGLDMWATVVDRDGEVQLVVFSGAARGDQWPGSRVISAQKANTANDYSLSTLAISTANLYAAVQRGNSLYGLQSGNPIDTDVAYGTIDDPLVGQKVGGVNVFGGGQSESGWGHPECSAEATEVARQLPVTHPIGPVPIPA